MYRKLPPISESAEELRQRMRQESHPKKRERLQMLYLLQSGQATTRAAVAQSLGVYRETIGHWLDAYVAGGLDGLLTLYVPAGKPSALTPEAMADLAQALHDPKGFGTYQEICDWLFAEHGITMRQEAMGHLVRTRFGGKPKVPRPTPKKTNRT
jgi:transposase